MELFRSISFNLNLKKQWRKRRYKYSRRIGNNNNTVVRLGGGVTKRVWKIRFRSLPKLRFKLLSPLAQGKKFKSLVVNFSRRIGGFGFGNAVDLKKYYGGDQVVGPFSYEMDEFENKRLYEIYKAFVASIELNYKYRQRMDL